ncbi:MAG TPA: type II secretion system F family protein [Candidatus Omnitrophota bacterium]|nr:type II secretion system F family protein [Candidatus Omnitrophota bacterium]
MSIYYAIFMLVAVSVYLLSESVLQFQTRMRLRTLGQAAPKKKLSITSLKFMQPLIRLTRPIANLPYLKKLKAQAEVLKLELDVPALVLLKCLFAIVAGTAILKLLGDVGYMILASLLGFFVPDILFIKKIRDKKHEITRVFPEVIDLIDLCIGAGLDFTSSVRWVIEKSATNAFVEQLETVLGEIQVGRNRTDALKNMAKRLQLSDISSFVRTVVQSERMGTSVEEAFRNLSEDTRLMRYQNGERYAIKASLKILFPLLFFILPVIMIIVAGPIIIKFTEGDLIPKTF